MIREACVVQEMDVVQIHLRACRASMTLVLPNVSNVSWGLEPLGGIVKSN